mgnify:FL=1
MKNTYLIFTNSVDWTADYISSYLIKHKIGFFRFNIDMWDQYKINVTSQTASLSDLTGRVIDLYDESIFLLWRKPFTDLMILDGLQISEEDATFCRRQISEFLKYVVRLLLLKNQVRLIEPYADSRLPKLLQLHIAKENFKIPNYSFDNISPQFFMGKKIITKPLCDPSIGKKIFYTSSVDKDKLFRPFPWFLQEAILGGIDITCVYINGECFFYQCHFKRDNKSVDWRTEINKENQSKWSPFVHKEVDALSKGVRKFMKSVNLHYGRIDFILRRDNFYFLECNSNGEFGWLDGEEKTFLHDKFIAAFTSTSSTVTI